MSDGAGTDGARTDGTGTDRASPTVPAGWVDTHIHVASDDEARFPKSPTGIGSTWFEQGGFGATAVLTTLRASGVDRMVAVQAAGVYGEDNRYVLAVALRHPGSVRAVVAVDLDRSDPATEIARLAGHQGVAGVRCMAVRPGSAWVGSDRADAAFAAARTAGLVVVLTVFSGQLPALQPVLERYGDVPVVLDHCAFAEVEGGHIADADPLRTMARLPQVQVKVTSHNFTHLGGPGARRAMSTELVDLFGPGRMLWGSDYPQTSSTSYGSLIEMAVDAFGALGPADRAMVMGANAQRVFGFPGPAAPGD